MKRMKRMWMGWLGAALVAMASGPATALTVPFTEDFASNAAGWVDAANGALTFNATGGPDAGSFVSTAFNYFGFSNPFGGGPVIFRGHAANAASGGAFVGDWSNGNVTQASAWVFQSTGVDLSFFLRVASTFNFPGAVIGSNQVVHSGEWTLVTWLIDANNPLCTGEGVSCAQALASVGNVQIGTNAPASLVGTNGSFGLAIDKVAIAAVPEPGTALLAAAGLLGLGALGRRRVA